MRDAWSRVDPRARLLLVLVATVLISSTPRGYLPPFAFYFPLILAFIALLSRASWTYIIARCVASSPFILMASGLLLFQYDLAADGRPAGIAPAASVAGKGYAAALLLSFLTESTPLSQLLWAMRKLGSPESLNMILSMMYRYTSLLEEEWHRLQRARDSRTVRPLTLMQMVPAYGRQAATLLLRSWERSERVHAAMLARGFDGSWPVWKSPLWTWFDGVFLACGCAAFAAAGDELAVYFFNDGSKANTVTVRLLEQAGKDGHAADFAELKIEMQEAKVAYVDEKQAAEAARAA